jgi:hypothetical protein
MAESNPVQKIRAGAISCAIWRNNVNVAGRTVPMLKASVERRYQASDGVWKSSGSFTRNEIPLAIFCLQQAFELMIKHGNAAEGAETNDLAV